MVDTTFWINYFLTTNGYDGSTLTTIPKRPASGTANFYRDCFVVDDVALQTYFGKITGGTWEVSLIALLFLNLVSD